MQERRTQLTDPAVLDALAHPVRLDVLGHLMSAGPATASQCARAVGDTPSNCSYHLRVLAAHGLVEPDGSGDGRSRPWRATVTGFTIGHSLTLALAVTGVLRPHAEYIDALVALTIALIGAENIGDWPSLVDGGEGKPPTQGQVY